MCLSRMPGPHAVLGLTCKACLTGAGARGGVAGARVAAVGIAFADEGVAQAAGRGAVASLVATHLQKLLLWTQASCTACVL